MMTRLLCVVALAGLLTGCQATETAQADTVSLGAVSLCNGCGHVKGTDACCAGDAAVCACGLHKGSIGCCKIEAGYRGDVYPSLGMWELTPTGAFASYPVPESLNVMYSGGF